jgi:hypothetical protein
MIKSKHHAFPHCSTWKRGELRTRREAGESGLDGDVVHVHKCVDELNGTADGLLGGLVQRERLLELVGTNDLGAASILSTISTWHWLCLVIP